MNPFRRSWVAPVLQGLILVVLAVVYFRTEPRYLPAWQIHERDAAEYVITAENFWGLPVHPTTFSAAWTDFLTRLPYRQIGVGTFQIVVSHLFPGDPNAAGLLLLHIGLGASYAFFAFACQRRFNLLTGLAGYTVLLLTTDSWAGGRELLSEPFARIFLTTLLAGMLLPVGTDGYTPRWRLALTFVLGLLLALIKIQWFPIGVLLIGAQVITFYRRGRTGDAALALGLIPVIPAICVLINWIGWDYPRLTAGASAHYMYRSEGTEFLQSACKDPEVAALSPRFCKEGVYRFRAWEFAPFEYGHSDVRALITVLDDRVPGSVDLTPLALWQTLWSGITEVTNFPNSRRTAFKAFCDFAAPIFCLAGLFFGRMRLACAAALLAWLNPVMARHVAVWDSRYIGPTAGLTLIMGALVIVRFATDRFSSIPVRPILRHLIPRDTTLYEDKE